MISMLRLINPPGHRPRKGWKMPKYAGRNPTARRRVSGEYAVSALRTAAAKKRARAAAAMRRRWLESRGVSENPRPRRRAVTRKTVTLKRDRHGRFLKRTTVRRTVVTNPRRKQGVKAMTRKRVTHRRRVRHNPVAANPRRRRRTRRNPYRGSSAAYRSGWDKTFGPVPTTGATVHRTRKAKKAKKAGHRKTVTKIVYVKAAPKKRRAHKTVAKSRRRVFRPRRHKGRVVRVLSLPYAPWSKKRVGHKIRARRGSIKNRKTGRKHSFMRYSVSRNPGINMKNMLMDGAALYGGYVGAKIVSGLLTQYVFNTPSLAPTMLKLGKAGGLISPAISFVLAAFAGKLIPQPKIVSSIQTGATLALFQAVVSAFVPKTGLPLALQSALSGIDDMGFRGYGYGMGEYIQQRPQQLGAYVQEAMALDEYIQEPAGMHGYEVQEALADSEVQGMQSGFAAGSLAKTVFSNF